MEGPERRPFRGCWVSKSGRCRKGFSADVGYARQSLQERGGDGMVVVRK
jgi:hypothetical protein